MMMNKAQAREMVWKSLRQVALPDSRFHYDFNSFIPDFEYSARATERLRGVPAYQQAEVIFITPDNCLDELRACALRDGKRVLVTTYGIRRGMVELRPEQVPAGQEMFAASLDGMEKIGSHLTLPELKTRYPKIDLLVTGASVVTRSGVRFGKGHGFFDLEWAVLYELGVVDVRTPIAAFVHDCQLVDVDLDVSAFDTICDYVVTPTQVIAIPNAHKPTQGILWDQLKPGMIEDISWLQEMQMLKHG